MDLLKLVELIFTKLVPLGATVLAHSLRDNGTKAKLVALYTPDTLQYATVKELQTVYDEIIPVQTATNHTPANLWLMDRPDLISTFTKIALWRQTQFKKIVYIDCDVVAVRAPDELLTLEEDFAAAPDVGWPDIFNSGVMVLRPNLQDYYALKALAERGISFDGADQGLLNMHFRNWHRLSFTYNCTPSANYQYIPAYKHFQSTISLIHFIGAQKPWNLPRQVLPVESPYNQLLGRWWAIYDRHYRPVVTVPVHSLPSRFATVESDITTYPQETVPQPSRLQISHPPGEASSYGQVLEIQHDQHVASSSEQALGTHYETSFKSEPSPLQPHTVRSHSHAQVEQAPHEEVFHDQSSTPHGLEGSHVDHAQAVQEEHHPIQSEEAPVRSAVPQYVRGEEHVSAYVLPHSSQPAFTIQSEQPTHQATSAPSLSSEPSAANEVHHAHLEPELVVEDQEQPTVPSAPLVEVETFEAPKAEWDAAREPPPLNSKPEGFALSERTYTMSEDQRLFQPPASYPEAPKNMWYQVPETKPEPEKVKPIFPWESRAPKPTRVFLEDQPNTVSTESASASTREEYKSSIASMASWTAEEPSTATWETYSRSNAWDEVPEIHKYIQSIQHGRKAKVQVISGGPSPGTEPSSWQTTDHGPMGMRVTDFPTELERPSLPVTPAPIRRSFGQASGDESTDEQLPIAEGVPKQDDWNPLARLEELCRRQSEVLENADLLVRRV
ncbi:glycogenin glucosyltransferase [Aspergillus pseudoviridinutans]|uniref:glycogenin glucosyltransferase n=1 Tax=Aspergillus pseudoviridinutans TaxID=1517512 RepID=A0A9P3B7X9_9EURO|nr:glycogenin glucosyltransferase [Aspergillus pseudoviridinutans]GIJ84360.1 glycogenin glucosyltransferase [Aspergillus pseudoviridinutans]